MAKVKVRVAVAVDSNGEWGCAGWKSDDKRDLTEMVGLSGDALSGDQTAYYWITAELEIPTLAEVAADVQAASNPSSR